MPIPIVLGLAVERVRQGALTAGFLGALALGRKVDEAFAAYQPAREALEEAWRRCQEAIARLPANGELDAAAANGFANGSVSTCRFGTARGAGRGDLNSCKSHTRGNRPSPGVMALK